jgi:hypothetical protein
MKRTLFTLALLAGFGFSFISCEDIDDEGVEMRTDRFEVLAEDWVWNDIYKRYEYVSDYREIDNYMYYDGAVAAGVYITEINDQGKSYEVLRPLPFEFYVTDRGRTITGTVGYDVSPGDNRYPGQIAFYIQPANQVENIIFLNDYLFKVTTFWRE